MPQVTANDLRRSLRSLRRSLNAVLLALCACPLAPFSLLPIRSSSRNVGGKPHGFYLTGIAVFSCAFFQEGNDYAFVASS